MLKSLRFFGLGRCFVPFFLLVLSCLRFSASAQNVNVAGALVGNGTYPTLQSAFTAINGGAQTATNIIVTIVNNTTETGTAVLNQSAGVWTTLSIGPSGAITVNGNIAGPLIDLNGADNVSINGLNSGGNSLTIVNTSTSNLASTIRLINDARSNLIANCTIQGSSTGTFSTSTDGAVILFSTVAAGTGNDNNTVSANDIGPAGSNLPHQCIKSSGTATRENKNNIISNNLIHDYFSPGTSTSNSKGIYCGPNTSGWTITGNRIYQTATRVWAAGGSGTLENIYSCIDVQSGSGYTINNNILGFGNSAGTGYTILTNPGASNYASMIHAITLNQTTAVNSTVNSNVIGGFDITSSRSKTTAGENIFLGIYIVAGPASVNTNTIGSATIANSILIRSTSLTTTGALPVPAVAIYNRGAGSNTINSNSVGGIRLSFGSPGISGGDRISLIGILNEGSGAINITGNNIGNSGAANISSSHRQGNVVGIMNSNSTALVRIQGNTIQNLNHSEANSGINEFSSVVGIVDKPLSGTVGTQIQANVIFNLSNTYGGGGFILHVRGIFEQPLSGGTISLERNRVHTLTVTSSVTGSSAIGIQVTNTAPGTPTINMFNNMISIGNTQGTNLSIAGVRQDGAYVLSYHNSIRIMGTSGGGSDSSFAYLYNTSGNLFRSRNNIYYNERTGGTGLHLAIRTVNAPFSYQASNNLFYTVAAPLAMWTNISCATLANWSAFSAQDPAPASKQSAMVFASATDLHTTDLVVRNAGLSPLSPVVTLDIDNTTRPSCVDIGCDEFDVATIVGNTWTWLGSQSNLWCNSCNWDRETVPVATSDVLILDNRPRYPLLQAGVGCGNVTVNHFTVQQNASSALSGQMDVGTYTLTINGNATIAGTCLCTGATALSGITSGLIDIASTTQVQIVDIRNSNGVFPGTICKLRINKTAPTAVPSTVHEAHLRGNLIILYNFDIANGVLLSKTGATYDADENTAVNYKTITIVSDEPGAVTRQSIPAQETRNGFFQGRLNRRIKNTGAGNEYLFPLGYRSSGGTGVLADYFYTPAMMKNNSITNNQYMVGTYLNNNSNGTVDGVNIGFTGHGCMNAFEIDDIGGPTAVTCNNKEIDIVSTFYWDFQENTGAAANGDPVISAGALGAINYDLQIAGDVFNLQNLDGLTGSELRVIRRPSVVIPGNAGQGPFVSSAGTHSGIDISANTGIAMYSINAASLQGARRNGLTTPGGMASAGNGPSPLPVELIHFSAAKSGKEQVVCEWTTAGEINNDRFEVEAAREKDGLIVFEKIGVIAGAGTISENRDYSFTDNSPLSGRNYYRLKQIDFDGSSRYSQTVIVYFSKNKNFGLTGVYPNPFSTQATVSIYSAFETRMQISLENSLGQILFSDEQIVQNGEQSLQIYFPQDLSAGVYFMRLMHEDESQVIRMIKQ